MFDKVLLKLQSARDNGWNFSLACMILLNFLRHVHVLSVIWAIDTPHHSTRFNPQQQQLNPAATHTRTRAHTHTHTLMNKNYDKDKQLVTRKTMTKRGST